MDATCNNCNHWDTSSEVIQDKTGFGACNELSQPKAEMHFILPVVQGTAATNAGFITGADFGCNHFAAGAAEA